MKIVEVFKTNVEDHLAAGHIIFALQQTFPCCTINFDLADCDKILRIESQQEPIAESEIQSLVAGLGYYCERLPD